MEDKKPSANEEILYSANPSMFRNHPIWYMGIIIVTLLGCGLAAYLAWIGQPYGALASLVILTGGGFFSYLFWWLQCKGSTLTVTNDRTKLRRGILAKSVSEVWHQDVRNVQLDQTFLQRILGVGRIGVSSAAQAEIEIIVNGIPEPDKIKSLIDEHRKR